jgi:uncharacterized protein YgiM (DUF1202 family)
MQHIGALAACLLVAVSAVSGQTAAPLQTVRVTSDDVNLRDKPSADGKVVATINKSMELQVLDKAGAWYHVRVKPSGPEGYINATVRAATAAAAKSPAARSASRPEPTAAASSARVNSTPPPAAAPPTPVFRPHPDGRYTLFISAPERDGFVDTTKEIEDSIKDIKNQLGKQKNSILNITNTRADADILLTIVKRGVGVQAYGQRTTIARYYGGTTLEDTPMLASTFWVSTVMQVGKYKKEFTGQKVSEGSSEYSFGEWKDCAGQIARNVTSWVAANARK